MAIRISCPCCAGALRVRDSSAGKTARCPPCTAHFVVGSEPVRVTKPGRALKPEARPNGSSSRHGAGGQASWKPILLWTGLGIVAALVLLGGSVVLLNRGQRPDAYASSTDRDPESVSKLNSTPTTKQKKDPVLPKPEPTPIAPDDGNGAAGETRTFDHSGFITGVAVSQDGRRAVSCCGNLKGGFTIPIDNPNFQDCHVMGVEITQQNNITGKVTRRIYGDLWSPVRDNDVHVWALDSNTALSEKT